MEERSVALDGPAGAGKSTLAKRAARHFKLIYVDTGALYRCVGLSALRAGLSNTRDETEIIKLLDSIDLELRYNEAGEQRVCLGTEDVSAAIRMPEVSAIASDISAIPAVREFLLSEQRGMASRHDVIMDGRDIGTVILPKAGLKVFLTAEVEYRARRRFDELAEQGVKTSFDEVLSEMKRRDYNDTTRKTAPLKAAPDAVMLDTTHMNLDESFDALCRLISERYGI